MRSRLLSGVMLTAAAFGVAAVDGGATTAHASAKAGQHVRPGADVNIAGMHCKVGLLLHAGKKVYAAVPASCTALPGNEGHSQSGCSAAAAPVGTPLRIAGARRRATLVYDSFSAMQRASDRNPNQCYYNDLALLKLKPVDAKRAIGTVPGAHAPKRISKHAPAKGSKLSSDAGVAVADAAANHGWRYNLSSAPSFTQADVGTPFVQGKRLVGMLTQLPESKDVVMTTETALSNLHRALHMMRRSPRSGFHHLTFRHVKLLKAGQQI